MQHSLHTLHTLFSDESKETVSAHPDSLAGGVLG